MIYLILILLIHLPLLYCVNLDDFVFPANITNVGIISADDCFVLNSRNCPGFQGSLLHPNFAAFLSGAIFQNVASNKKPIAGSVPFVRLLPPPSFVLGDSGTGDGFDQAFETCFRDSAGTIWQSLLKCDLSWPTGISPTTSASSVDVGSSSGIDTVTNPTPLFFETIMCSLMTQYWAPFCLTSSKYSNGKWNGTVLKNHGNPPNTCSSTESTFVNSIKTFASNSSCLAGLQGITTIPNAIDTYKFSALNNASVGMGKVNSWVKVTISSDNSSSCIDGGTEEPLCQLSRDTACSVGCPSILCSDKSLVDDKSQKAYPGSGNKAPAASATADDGVNGSSSKSTSINVMAASIGGVLGAITLTLAGLLVHSRRTRRNDPLGSDASTKKNPDPENLNRMVDNVDTTSIESKMATMMPPAVLLSNVDQKASIITLHSPETPHSMNLDCQVRRKGTVVVNLPEIRLSCSDAERIGSFPWPPAPPVPPTTPRSTISRRASQHDLEEITRKSRIRSNGGNSMATTVSWGETFIEEDGKLQDLQNVTQIRPLSHPDMLSNRGVMSLSPIADIEQIGLHHGNYQADLLYLKHRRFSLGSSSHLNSKTQTASYMSCLDSSDLTLAHNRTIGNQPESEHGSKEIEDGLVPCLQEKNQHVDNLNVDATPPLSLSDVPEEYREYIDTIQIAQANFDARLDDEIEIRIGDNLHIEWVWEDGWCIGSCNDTNQHGAFPFIVLQHADFYKRSSRPETTFLQDMDKAGQAYSLAKVKSLSISSNRSSSLNIPQRRAYSALGVLDPTRKKCFSNSNLSQLEQEQNESDQIHSRGSSWNLIGKGKPALQHSSESLDSYQSDPISTSLNDNSHDFLALCPSNSSSISI